MAEGQLLHLAVRWLHVAAMAVAFGGAALVLVLASRSPRTVGGAASLLQIAASYEWTFWAAAGVLAMTGIGNLGAFGGALPAPATRWGSTFVLKLSLVVVLVLLSLPRTLVVGRLSATTATSSDAVALMRRAYGLTAAAFAVVLALAVWLAHG